MTTNIITRIALLAGIAAVLPCSLFVSAAGNNTAPETADTQTETEVSSFICTGGMTLEGDADENVTNIDTCTYTYFIPEDGDHGDLTDAEFEELTALYERLETLNSEGSENTAEIDEIQARITELEKKAGWLFEFSDEDLKAQLSEEAYVEYEQINGEIQRLYARIDEILAEAGITAGDDVSISTYTSTDSDES